MPSFDYDPATGSLSLLNIPYGTFSASIRVDANKENPPLYPGDYRANIHFSVTASTSSIVKVPMERIIHLIKPQDNNVPMTGWDLPCKDKISYTSPVLFMWEPMGKGVTYTYTITTTRCNPFKQMETVAGDTTSKTQVLLSLPPSKPAEYYLLKIFAYKNGQRIGSLMTHGSNGFSWDYRFRITSR